MAVAIDRITPGRGFVGDILTIEGSGFAATVGATTVTVDGMTADVVSASPTAIAIVVPSLIETGKHVPVVVENTSDGTSDGTHWWSATTSGLATARLPIAVHGSAERTLNQSDSLPGVLMARTWERLVTMAEAIPFDMLTSKGRMAARGSTGLTTVAAGTAYQRYIRQASTGGAWRDRVVLSWGYACEVQAAQTSEVQLPWNAWDAGGSGSEEEAVVVSACRLSLIQVAARTASPAGNAITRVRAIVNGSAAWDSDSLATALRPNVVANGVWRAAPWLSLSAGDRVALGVTKNGSTSVMAVQGRMLFT